MRGIKPLTRDLLGRTVREQVNGNAVTSEYDAAGNLTVRTTPSGARSQWAYDAIGDAASLTAGSDTVTFVRAVTDRIWMEFLTRIGLEDQLHPRG